MSIEKALKFAAMAVARKDYVEELCHFLIKDGAVTAYDGLLSMSTPIDIDLHVKPHASRMIKAIQACDDDAAIALHVTPANRLSVRSGKFRAYVECLSNEKDMVLPLPEGPLTPVNDRLLDSIRTLAPLMGIDASRPWAQGLLICGNSTYATNNIIVAEYWHGSNFPGQVIIPADAVNALLKAKLAPEAVQMTETSLTFHMPEKRWLRTQLVVGDWPLPQVQGLLAAGGDVRELPAELFTSLEKVKPFVSDTGAVRLTDNGVTTSQDEQDGAAIDFEFPGGAGVFNINQLLLLKEFARKVDFTAYPKPCYFQGAKVRGVILGMNVA